MQPSRSLIYTFVHNGVPCFPVLGLWMGRKPCECCIEIHLYLYLSPKLLHNALELFQWLKSFYISSQMYQILCSQNFNSEFSTNSRSNIYVGKDI